MIKKEEKLWFEDFMKQLNEAHERWQSWIRNPELRRYNDRENDKKNNSEVKRKKDPKKS